MPAATASGVVRFGGFFGNAVSEGAAFAIGLTTAPTLAPLLEELKNATWRTHPTKEIDAGTAAGIVAEDVKLRDWGAHKAAAHGIDGEQFDAMLGEALNAPGVPQLFEAWRRDLIDDAAFEHGLRKAKLEPQWDDVLKKLKTVLLPPGQIALGVVRSILKSDGLLVEDLDTGPGNVKRYPESSIDPVKEAARWGITREQLRVMVGEIGLPMATLMAASAYFRGILTKTDYNAAVSEGDVRPEWGDAILETARQILSATDYVNAHIRGYRSEAEMREGAALHGMSQEDVDLLYLIHGRPAAMGQMATAAARGIDGPEGRPVDRAQFLQAVAESDIKTKYGPMLWESRYLYPPLFQLTRLVQANAIDADTAREWAVKDRYPPEVVNALHRYWLTLGGATTGTYTSKAQTQLWTTTHRSFVAGESDEDTVRANLDVLGVPAADQDAVLRLWGLEASTIRRQLTAAQVKKAYAKLVTNPATGAKWTRDDAVEALVNRGYTVNDANTFLDTP